MLAQRPEAGVEWPRPAARAATIARRCPTDPLPVRSPACASSTARPCWPGRTARCCSATWAPTSSRSSRPTATRRAAGDRRGSGRRPATASRTAAYYLAVNRNKRSLRLDLRTPDGKAVLRRLLAEGDVVVENFRVGGFARLGFDDDELARLNPRLVHLAISGYGTRGAAASRPGYDFVIQAASGLMSITGATDEDGGEPTKVGVAISDVVTGMLGAVGLLAALVGRGGAAGGGAAGGGQRVDVSILGATLASLVNQAQNAFATDRAPGRLGNAHPSIVPYESFATADGAIAIAVGSSRQWVRLCEALAIPDLADDPRFATNGDRVDHRGGPPADPRRPVRDRHDRPLAGHAWRRRRCPAARSTTSSRRSTRPRRARSG